MDTKDKVIALALKAGFAHEVATGHIVATSGYTEVVCTAGLERFYQLARADMKEQCAKVCEEQNPIGSVNQEWMQERCATAIRALEDV